MKRNKLNTMMMKTLKTACAGLMLLMMTPVAHAGDAGYEETMQWMKTAVLSAPGRYHHLTMTWDNAGNMKYTFKDDEGDVLSYKQKLGECTVIKEPYLRKDEDTKVWYAGCTSHLFKSKAMASRFAKAWHHAYIKTQPSSLF